MFFSKEIEVILQEKKKNRCFFVLKEDHPKPELVKHDEP